MRERTRFARLPGLATDSWGTSILVVGCLSKSLASGQPMIFLRWYFFIAPNFLLGCCAFLLWRQRLHRIYPIFGAYVGFQLLLFIVLFTTDLLILPSITSLEMYRSVLVVGTGIGAVLQVGVVYELACELLLSRSSLANSLRPLLRWSLALALLIATGSSALLPRTSPEPLMLAFQNVNFASNLIAMGLLLALILCARAFGISWRALPAGIALGFGIDASGELCGSALLSVLVGHKGYITADFIRQVAGHLSVLIWLVYILKPERLPSFKGKHLGKGELETWGNELQKVVS